MNAPISELDWNFDKVPDSELVACCYWEYARDSAFIRSVRQRCLDPKWREMVNSELWEFCGHDIERIQSIGYESEVILQGFFFAPNELHDNRHPNAPPITGQFPDPWQKFSEEERIYRAHIGNDIVRVPLVPFKRGQAHDAKDINDFLQLRRRQRDAENNRVRSQYPDKNEQDLISAGKLKIPEIVPSAFWVSGMEVTVVSIQWAQFTNDEIANYFRRWVKANRPAEIPVPSEQGHRLVNARVNLERLAVMRLLHRCQLAELKTTCPEAWERYHTPNRRWRNDVEKAKAHFRILFPFLPKNELPRSWPPRK